MHTFFHKVLEISVLILLFLMYYIIKDYSTFSNWFCSTNHKIIGMLYLFFGLWVAFLATFMSVLIRRELGASGDQVFLGDYSMSLLLFLLLVLAFHVWFLSYLINLFLGFKNKYIYNISIALNMLFVIVSFAFYLREYQFDSVLFLCLAVVIVGNIGLVAYSAMQDGKDLRYDHRCGGQGKVNSSLYQRSTSRKLQNGVCRRYYTTLSDEDTTFFRENFKEYICEVLKKISGFYYIQVIYAIDRSNYTLGDYFIYTLLLFCVFFRFLCYIYSLLCGY